MVLLLETNTTGPSCRFTDSDAFLYLEHVSRNNRVGRKDLSAYLGIGEGSVRTLTEMMRDAGFIDVKQTGITLRPAGAELLKGLGLRTVDISVGRYVIGADQFGVVLKNMAERVCNGIDQRNTGLRTGGDGCTTWVCDNGRIVMLPDWDVDEHDPALSLAIRGTAAPDDGDVLIVGGGRTRRLAMVSAVGAALDII